MSQHPDHLADHLDSLRQSEPDALCYMGYGMLAAQGLLREALDELAWDPPRIMSTAFMFYLMGFEKFEGWVGIDQFDPNNPRIEGFHEPVRRPPRGQPADVAERHPRARLRHRPGARRGPVPGPTLSGPGLKDGLERIRFMPSTTGGPRTHIACAPHDHGMFRGDWLLYGRVRDAKVSSSKGSSSRRRRRERSSWSADGPGSDDHQPKGTEMSMPEGVGVVDTMLGFPQRRT